MTNQKIPLVTVYSLPACVQCNATKRLLSQQSIPYIEVNLEDKPELTEAIKSYGFTSAPVVQVGSGWGQAWAGFEPEKIRAIKG